VAGADVSTDTTAYMMLVTCDTQGELTALERGLHALHSVPNRKDLDVKAYAARAGRAKEYDTVRREVLAAEVATVCNVANSDHFIKLVEIHAAPAWLWPALVAAMLPSTRPMGEVLVDPGLGQGRSAVPCRNHTLAYPPASAREITGRRPHTRHDRSGTPAGCI
jgi:hypothetical protein